ncbi:MAG: hypothetical protein AAGC64_04555 [Bacteroidota bacterium]
MKAKSRLLKSLFLFTTLILFSCSSEESAPTDDNDMIGDENPVDPDVEGENPNTGGEDINLFDLTEGILQNISVSPATISNNDRSGVCPNTTSLPLAGTEFYYNRLDYESPLISFTYVNKGHKGEPADVLNAELPFAYSSLTVTQNIPDEEPNILITFNTALETNFSGKVDCTTRRPLADFSNEWEVTFQDNDPDNAVLGFDENGEEIMSRKVIVEVDLFTYPYAGTVSVPNSNFSTVSATNDINALVEAFNEASAVYLLERYDQPPTGERSSSVRYYVE